MSNFDDAIENQLAVSETKYGRFVVLKNDFIGKWMIRGDHFEDICITKIVEHLKPGDIVIDVGANIGCYSIPFAQAVGSNGRVYSFEPQGVIHEILYQNVLENNLQNIIKTYHMAVGHIDGVASLNGKCDRGRELQYDRKEETNFGGVNLGKGGEKIPMINLTGFVDKLKLGDRKVNLIKIDVEGAEKMVISGAKELIERDRPIVFYEDNYKKITKEMIDMFNLPHEIVNLNIRKYLMEELKYSKLIKIGENYLCLP